VARTNISILTATVLLGVLLYIERQIGNAGLESVTPQTSQPAPPPVAAETTRIVASPATLSGELPVIDGVTTLRSFLEIVGIDADAAIGATSRWFEDRGYLGTNPLLGNEAASATRDYYASLDDGTLRALSDANDAGATQELAARQRLVDPFAALGLFERAAQQGSVNAMLALASLQETLADVRPEDFSTDPEYARQLSRLGGRNAESNLRLRAFVSAVTALRDGGPPVADETLLDWVDGLAERIPAERVRAACNESFAYFLALSARRRETGLAPVTTKPPPVFLAAPDLDDRLPCRDTVNPIVGTLDLSDCAATEVADARGNPRLLYVCTDG
jgi:hypothetical protein